MESVTTPPNGPDQRNPLEDKERREHCLQNEPDRVQEDKNYGTFLVGLENLALKKLALLSAAARIKEQSSEFGQWIWKY